MRTSPYKPALHVFVCTNARAEDDPLGPGCGPRGEALFEALRGEVRGRGIGGAVWVTRTRCLGVCPKIGAAAATYGAPGVRGGAGLFTEVLPEEAGPLLDIRPAVP